MKTVITAVLFILLIVSCKNGNDKGENEYAGTVVGTARNGEVDLGNIEQVKEKWEKAINKDNPGTVLEGFEIIKGIGQGEEGAEYYMLLSRTDDGHIIASALLTLKGSDLYLVKDEGSGDVMPLVICKGGCEQGCMPIVTTVNGKNSISCTQCLDCTKQEMEAR